MRATISDVTNKGLILKSEDKTKPPITLWLPAEEWSLTAADWEAAKLSSDLGDELDVVLLLGRVFDGRQVVSRKAANIKVINESDSSNTAGMVREMRIVEVARSVIRGHIGDRIPAIVTHQSYQSYLDWVSSKDLQELSDHAVLGKGDVVRGFVTGERRDDGHASVVIDISNYLAYRDREVETEVISGGARPTADREESTSAPKKIQADNVPRISPVLLVDDNECRDSIAKILRYEGVEVDTLENTSEAQKLLSDLSTNSPLRSKYQLAILDPNLEEHSTDLIGLEIASKLREKTKCRVVLMTGEVKNTTKLERWPNLEIHGYIEKPFTMESLIDEIEEAIRLPKPQPLSNWIGNDVSSLQRVKSTHSAMPAYDPSEISMEEAIQRLGRLKPGTVIHVFELHPRSFRARSLCSYGGDSLRWLPLRGKIAKSVIKDVAESPSPIIHNDVNLTQQLQQVHLWTLQMMNYRSFCGIPIHVKGKRIAMVAFHPEKNAFDINFQLSSIITGEKVGRAMERTILYGTRRNEADLASFGMALASLAHELASDMTALDANLKDLSVLASGELVSPSTMQPLLETLELIRGDVDVISTKTRILRRTHASSDRVSIGDCLKKAATACRTVIGETIKHPARIMVKPVAAPKDVLEVKASMASLIIIFFNLYLNAAQQIDIASSVRRHGLIWNTITLFKDARNKAWARVRIHDTGPGIHRDDWERIFEPGYSTKPDGSGLGLYICRYLLQDIPQASLSVTSSAIWDGTTVTVNLPLLTN